MKNNPIIRLIKTADISKVFEIYKPFVTLTTITPEHEITDPADFSKKIKKIAAYYPVLVCEMNDIIVGYTFASRFRLAQGHQWSVETSIYLVSGYYGRGVAKTLYQTLFNILKLQNLINVFAGIVLPNARSEAFHKNLGFQEVGIFEKGIYKFGNWHDVKWSQLSLKEHSKNPLFPKSIKEVMHTTPFADILKRASIKNLNKHI